MTTPGLSILAACKPSEEPIPEYAATDLCPLSTIIDNNLESLVNSTNTVLGLCPNSFANQLRNVDLTPYSSMLAAYKTNSGNYSLTLAFFKEHSSRNTQNILGNQTPENIATQHEFSGAPLIFWAEIKADGILELGMKFYENGEQTMNWSIRLKPPSYTDTPLAEMSIVEKSNQTRRLTFDGTTKEITDHLPEALDSADSGSGPEPIVCNTYNIHDYQNFYDAYHRQITVILTSVANLITENINTSLTQQNGDTSSWAGLFTHVIDTNPFPNRIICTSSN